MLIYCIDVLVFVSVLLLPFVKPKTFNNAFYLVNIPFLLTVGLGSVFAGPNSFVYSASSESIARQGLAVYLIVVFIFSSARQFSLKSLGIGFDETSSSLNSKFINQFSLPILFVFMALCLPYWATIDIKSSGIYTLFFDPASHLLAREETIKLAEQTYILRLFSLASALSPLLILVVLMSNYPKIPFVLGNLVQKIIIILVITILSNINGSRSGFTMPLLVAGYSLFILDFRFFRTQTVRKLLNLKSLLLENSLITTFFGAMFSAVSVLFVILYASFLRISRELTLEFAIILLSSVANRAFIVPFSTGISNIWAVNDLNLPFSYYFGGFPGVIYLFGEREPLFMATGSHYLALSKGVFATTMNMNTSGLFVNIAFWGLFGVLLFSAFISLNIFYFPRFLRAMCRDKLSIFLSPILSALMIAEVAFNISSSTISFFPMQWILFASLLGLLSILLRIRLKLLN